ncbi:MAG: hypothetical protein AB7W59_02205 [Acidimicrobiia bacterium]
MTLDLAGIRAAVESHALASGHLDRSTGHEPDHGPGQGISAAVWVDEVRPVRARSGLASTSALVVLQLRLQMPMTYEPADDIDPLLLGAADALMRAYSGDFELGGEVAAVDLLGMSGGPSLQGKAGYLPQDDQLYRVFVITLPLLVDDLWEQVA